MPHQLVSVPTPLAEFWTTNNRMLRVSHGRFVVSLAERIGVVTTFALRNRSEEAPPSEIFDLFHEKEKISTPHRHTALDPSFLLYSDHGLRRSSAIINNPGEQDVGRAGRGATVRPSEGPGGCALQCRNTRFPKTRAEERTGRSAFRS